MKRSKFTEQQVVAILKEADAGESVKEICRRHGLSPATFYQWKSKSQPESGSPRAPDVSSAEPLPPLGDNALFREEAVRSHAESAPVEGDLIRISPRWAEGVYWFLTAAFVVAILAVCFGRVREYASGPAVVRLAGQIELTARATGTVAAVTVATGDRVESGQVVVRYDARAEESEVEKLQLDFDAALIRLLRDPQDPLARTAVGSVRAELEFARARLEQRVVRSPVDGIVYDVRALAGQLITPGEPLASVVQGGKQHEVVALIPGRYGPLLHPGQTLQLQLTGYVHSRVDLTIRDVGDGIVGPSEVRRFLGSELGDAVTVVQPVVLARASLPSATFESDGKAQAYCSGLQGTAEICVSTEPVVYSLLPWTKSIRGKWNARH